MKRQTAAILTIGTELTVGHTLNSHAQYITRALNGAGYDVSYHISCADDARQIVSALQFLADSVELIAVTGGLGPTQDDITRQCIGQLLQVPLVEDLDSKRKLEGLFKNFASPLTANNYRQIMFPQGARILVNDEGTADGFIVAKGGLTIAALPGPPREMKHVLTRLLDTLHSGKVKCESSLKLFGAGESAIDAAIADLSADGVAAGIYVDDAIITVRLTAYAADEATAKARIAPLYRALRRRLADLVFAEGERALGEVVIAKLRRKGLTISAAESCTGGRVAAELTAFAGASATFIGGVVSYHNREKIRQLDVPQTVLDRFGAVSRETAAAMLSGLLARTKSDVGVAITGIAGPSGGSLEKPVGLVYIAVGDARNQRIYKHQFKRNRARNQRYATLYALKAVLDFIDQA